MKGTEVHRGRGFASRPFKPSAEADGKREPAGFWRMADTACFLAIPRQAREQPVPVLDTGPQKNRRYRPSQEKAQLSKKGLSGRASSGGRRRSVRSMRCLSEASFAGDSGAFDRSSPDG
ncbi:hypothetical protein [uncultured Parabacteroides sp.]|uniref:hypothetical protein n=1 Tax=uncultured Parabacteroides sp. TaxID=512312 RepID=UPI0028047600|nr:hypothetical protein [uncultured Parabacteroides sp.]